MKKEIDKFNLYEEGHKKVSYTVYFKVFDPNKHFVSTDEIKDILRKQRHLSKTKVKTEYDTIFATWEKVGLGRNRHVEFNLAPKSAANVIFVFPKKHRKEVYKWVGHYLELPVSILK